MCSWYDKALALTQGKTWTRLTLTPVQFIACSLLVTLLSVSANSFAANLGISPNNYDFGNVGVGGNETQNFLVGNENTFAVDLGQAVVYGNVSTTLDAFGNVTTIYEPSPDFTLDADNCSNRQLFGYGDDSCNTTVAFTPESVGIKNATLGIPSNDPATPLLNVNLVGTGALLPNIVVEPNTLAFGSEEIGFIATIPLNIKNTGAAPLNLGTITYNSPFNVPNTCDNQAIMPGGSCVVDAQFIPSEAGTVAGQITISSDDPETPSLTLRATGTGTGTPNISIQPADGAFGTVDIGNSNLRTYTIANTGSDALHVGQISLQNSTSSGFVLNNYCSNKALAANGSCNFNVRYQPLATETATATLTIPSNDPDSPLVTMPLSASSECLPSTNAQFSSYSTLDFGTEANGSKATLRFAIHYNGQGCLTNKITDIQLQGTDASEFKIVNNRCYHRQWPDWRNAIVTRFSSSCYMEVVFEPQIIGTKQAEIKASLDTTSVAPHIVPIQAVAVDGIPSLTVTPTSYDFGQVEALIDTDSVNIVLQNTGNVNLKVKYNWRSITGSTAFTANAWLCTHKPIKPGASCTFAVDFKPVVNGQETATFTIDSNAAPQQITLAGEGIGLVDCEPENITIRSNTLLGRWDDPASWERLQPIASTNLPTADDVVMIKSGNTIAGQAVNRVKALCVERQGRLHSPLTGEALEVLASHYIENKGTIYGLNGHKEAVGANCTRSMLGQVDCAQPGAGVILKVGKNIRGTGKAGDIWWNSYDSGGPILNEGSIIGGNGGAGSIYGADGGVALVLGRNTDNRGVIRGGHGGDVTGLGDGEAGRGGLVQIWGKLGGRGYLKSMDGAQAIAGDGGNCNPATNGSQIAGRGGNLWFVSLPDVFLGNGIHKSGKRGSNCQVQAEKSWIRIEPGVISLAGSNTQVEGGDVFIYGGNDWTLDLSGLPANAIQAEGKIVLSVGEGGTINMDGMSNGALQAGEKLQVFTDTLVTSEGQTLDDATNTSNILLAPAQILQDVSLSSTRVAQRPSTASTPNATDDSWAVNLSLSNNGPTADTYALTVTDTAGWTFSNLPETIEVAELTTVDLALFFPVSANVGATNVITVTAISQSNPDVTSSTVIEVTVTDVEVVTTDAATIPNTGTVSTGGGVSTGGTSGCVSSGTIDSMCVGGQQVLVDVNISVNGVVSNVTLSGTINNEGIVSQATIESEATVTGGKFTGYIDNAGTLVDIEFVGASLSGGTLAGTTVNSSRAEGVISDVQFAADASLLGGQLSGMVQGDVNAPASLEGVEIVSGATLSGVIINPDVLLPTDVTLGQGVRFKYPLAFNGSLAVTPSGEFTTPDTQFGTGVARSDFNFTTADVVSIGEQLYFSSQITVPAEHVGQTADILLVFGYEPFPAPYDGGVDTQYFNMDAEGLPLPVDLYATAEEWMAQLTSPFMSSTVLDAEILVNVWQGQLQEPGMYYFFVGYQLQESGQVVYSNTPVFVEVQ